MNCLHNLPSFLYQFLPPIFQAPFPMSLSLPLILLPHLSISTLDCLKSYSIFSSVKCKPNNQPSQHPLPRPRDQEDGQRQRVTYSSNSLRNTARTGRRYTRTSEIRSHAQKFFERIGPARTKEFERKAKILEAIETLEYEKLLQKAEASGRAKQERKFLQPIVKAEENSILEKPQISGPSEMQNRSGELRPLEYIKEQFEQEEERKVQAPLMSEAMVQSPPAQQTSQLMYAPFYWYANAYAMNSMGTVGNPYNQGYM